MPRQQSAGSRRPPPWLYVNLTTVLIKIKEGTEIKHNNVWWQSQLSQRGEPALCGRCVSNGRALITLGLPYPEARSGFPLACQYASRLSYVIIVCVYVCMCVLGNILHSRKWGVAAWSTLSHQANTPSAVRGMQLCKGVDVGNINLKVASMECQRRAEMISLGHQRIYKKIY